MHIDIVVLHYKNRDDTLCCLQSLFANTYRDFTVHLVNNGTTDTFPEMPRVIYYLLPVNLGFAGGNNHVLRLLQEGATSFLLLNNDTWVPPDYLEKLALWATNHPGIIGSKIVLYDDPHTLDHYGGIWDSERLTFDLIGYRQSSHETALPLDRLDYVTGCSLFAPTSALRAVGLLDEGYFLYFEEADWCLQAKRAGIPISVCPDAVVHHKVSRAVTNPSVTKKYYFWRNRLRYIRKNIAPSPFQRRILQEIGRLLLTLFLKEVHYLLLFPWTTPQRRLIRRTRIQGYVASLSGIFDYLKNPLNEL